MEKHLIIARYEEDLTWIKDVEVDRIFVYNKGSEIDCPVPVISESLPNIGKESHTYSYHIAQNYKSLAEINIFVQGHPFDHSSPNFINIINQPTLKMMNKTRPTYLDLAKTSRGFVALGSIVNYCPLYGDSWAQKRINPHFKDVDKSLPAVKWHVATPGAQFAVAKSNILSRTLGFYKNLIELHKHNKHMPITMECLWHTILSEPSIKLI